MSIFPFPALLLDNDRPEETKEASVRSRIKRAKTEIHLMGENKQGPQGRNVWEKPSHSTRSKSHDALPRETTISSLIRIYEVRMPADACLMVVSRQDWNR
jgi:hypothetical protein